MNLESASESRTSQRADFLADSGHVAREQLRGRDVAERDSLRLCRLLCGASLVLLGVTRAIWGSYNPLPSIPWFAPGTLVPRWLDWLLLSGLLLCLVSNLLLPTAALPTRRRWLLLTLAWGAVMLLDQNRAQPWTWEFWLIASASAALPAVQSRRVIQGLIISIYFYSAVSKIDAEFLYGLGPLLASGLCKPFGLDLLHWTPLSQQVAAAMLPAGELLIAALLCTRRWRSWGSYGSLAMHGGLILALGPCGLNHEWGVLCWNVYFIAQNLLLFRQDDAAIDRGASDVVSVRPQASSGVPHDSPNRAEFHRDALRQQEFGRSDATPASQRCNTSPWSVTATCVLAVITLYPALEWFGWCDPWPAWAVYSHRPIHVRPLVHLDAVHQFPESIRRWIGPPEPLTDWCPLPLDSVSFSETHTPLYPEGHYRAALFVALADHAGVASEHLMLHVNFPPQRWTRARSETTLRGREEILGWSAERWANVRAR
ncbi:MAG: hypothetical protein KDA58_02615 [Planctomycetaceae bacterium]|nr:hypothetical protein [Planctomycetaceae bacterium]